MTSLRKGAHRGKVATDLRIAQSCDLGVERMHYLKDQKIQATIVILMVCIINFLLSACQEPKFVSQEKACFCQQDLKVLKAELKREMMAELARPELEKSDKPLEGGVISDRVEALPGSGDVSDSNRVSNLDVNMVRRIAKEVYDERMHPVLPKVHNELMEEDPDGLKINSHVIATGIEKRLPTGVANTFSVDVASVYCYLEVASVYSSERTLTLRWIHSSGITQSYQLHIGESPAWRTWSKLNLTRSMSGHWQCEVFNEAGSLLSTIPFNITKG